MSEEELRATFREAIEAIRRDVRDMDRRFVEHMALCAERNRQQERLFWKMSAWYMGLIAVLAIGWIKLAGHGPL